MAAGGAKEQELRREIRRVVLGFPDFLSAEAEGGRGDAGAVDKSRPPPRLAATVADFRQWARLTPPAAAASPAAASPAAASTAVASPAAAASPDGRVSPSELVDVKMPEVMRRTWGRVVRGARVVPERRMELRASGSRFEFAQSVEIAGFGAYLIYVRGPSVSAWRDMVVTTVVEEGFGPEPAAALGAAGSGAEGRASGEGAGTGAGGEGAGAGGGFGTGNSSQPIGLPAKNVAVATVAGGAAGAPAKAAGGGSAAPAAAGTITAVWSYREHPYAIDGGDEGWPGPFSGRGRTSASGGGEPPVGYALATLHVKNMRNARSGPLPPPSAVRVTIRGHATTEPGLTSPSPPAADLSEPVRFGVVCGPAQSHHGGVFVKPENAPDTEGLESVGPAGHSIENRLEGVLLQVNCAGKLHTDLSSGAFAYHV